VQKNAPTPKVSVDVEFVPLWQTDEYKKYYGLEHVAMFDTVQVIYPPLNLDLKAKVVKTVYNVLADRYDEISVSTVKQTLTDTIFTLMKER
jgi:phage minor structural protein